MVALLSFLTLTIIELWIDALLALGYNSREVREIIGKVDSEASQGEQIKQALKLLAK
jgi:Holliday junction resolvasome RuvABC DNA-binding subunit